MTPPEERTAAATASPRLSAPAASPLDLGRDRLLDRLQLDPARLTLVCAPAGAGKTSLLAGWVARSPELTIAWLSLDRHDDDPGRLWSGVLAALRATGVFPSGSHLHELLAPAGTIDPGFIDDLLAEVATVGSPLWLVLDDVHHLQRPTALASLEVLVHRAPSNLHLVLAGRAEPAVGLPRLRLADAVRELRADDLAFTLVETSELVQRHAVELGDADIELLHRRTDGWAAGLQIACMAVAGGEDPTAFAARFDGDDHEVAAYLLTEVMAGLPAPTRRFMLRTSLCAELSVGLAQRLSDRTDAAVVLDELVERNAFTRRVGRGRTLYRYHDLLRSFLHAELRRTDPRAERELQHTAARWYQRQGDHLHAMEHLGAADAEAEVVELARAHGLAAILGGRSRRLHAALSTLISPDRRDPVIDLLLAAAALELGDLADADRQLAPLDLDRLADGPDRSLAVLAAAVGTARARFDLDIRAALQRLESTGVGSTGDADLDLYALHQRGVARLFVGAYAGSVADLERAAALAAASGREAMLLSCRSFLAGTYASWGDLPAAWQTAREAVALAEHRGWGGSQPVAHAHVLLGWTASLRGDRSTAERSAQRALASLGTRNEPDVELAARSLALYLAADRDEAFAVLSSYLELYERLADAEVSPALLGYAAPVLLTVALDLGERHRARTIADVAVRRAPDPGERALLRAMLQHDAGQPAAVRRELSPVLTGTARCHLPTTEVRAWLLAAIVEQAAGNHALALERLRGAIERAAPIELLQPFLEPSPLDELLIGSTGRFGRNEPFVDRILGQLAQRAHEHHDLSVRLTPSELEILRDLP